MKVLWLTDTPLNLTEKNGGYHGRGWIESEFDLMCKEKDITLAVGYNTNKDSINEKINGAFLYPIRNSLSFKLKFLNPIFRWLSIYETSKDIRKICQLIEEFKPDIIHLFGTEWYGLNVVSKTEIPVLVHLQGLAVPCYNAFLPPGKSSICLLSTVLTKPIEFLKANSFYFLRKRFRVTAQREEKLLKHVRYFMGRTYWDKQISRLYAPASQYFHLNEILRPSFYVAEKWSWKNDREIKILSVISDATYKGLDLIFKCASILENATDINIEWKICGVKYNMESVKLFRKNLISCKKVKIIFAGVVAPDLLITYLQETLLFVHPSYIDNSPNSICEAQYLGVPVIATNVGGVSSIIEDSVTGVLVPSNDPYSLACKLLEVANNKEIMCSLSKESMIRAASRNNCSDIINHLKTIYYQVDLCHTTKP